jgi:hypothetical protein
MVSSDEAMRGCRGGATASSGSPALMAGRNEEKREGLARVGQIPFYRRPGKREGVPGARPRHPGKVEPAWASWNTAMASWRHGGLAAEQLGGVARGQLGQLGGETGGGLGDPGAVCPSRAPAAYSAESAGEWKERDGDDGIFVI